ncbi:hypothetical protein AB205_0155810, partial [Aquarana catesbeiana]
FASGILVCLGWRPVGSPPSVRPPQLPGGGVSDCRAMYGLRHHFTNHNVSRYALAPDEWHKKPRNA